MKVVQFVARGLANKNIADELNVSQRTVESHVSNMLGKQGCTIVPNLLGGQLRTK